MSNIGLFRPDILFSQTENANKTYLQKERESRLKKEEESLMQEFEKSLKLNTSEQKTEDKEIVKLKKLYNQVHYHNKKKLQILDDLKTTAKFLKKKATDASEMNPSLSFVSGSLKDMQSTLYSKNQVYISEQQELIERLKDEINKVELQITQERCTTEQLESMQKKEKEDYIYQRERFLDCKAMNKGIDKYTGQIEDTTARAKNELIKANDNVVKLKTEIKKQSSSRVQKIEGIRSKGAHLKKEVEALVHKVAESAIGLEENEMKNEMLKSEYGKLLTEFDQEKQHKQSYANQLEYYTEIFEKIKKIIKESKCLSISPEKVDKFSPKDILKAFENMLSMESRLQIRFIGLAADQYQLRQICDETALELSELKEDPGLSGNIQELRSRTRKLTKNETFEVETYTGLLVSLDTINSVSKEELIGKYEQIIVFSLKFFYQLAWRVKKQLELIKEQCYGHPEVLQDYILHIPSMFKDVQTESTPRPNKNDKRNTVIILPANANKRKQSTFASSPITRDFSLKPEETISSIKFQNLNKTDLQDLYLGIFPGFPTIAQSFVSGILENTIMRYFLDNETIYQYLRDCRDQYSGQLSAIVNLSQLSVLAHRNLKKQLTTTLEALSGLLINTTAADKEISAIIDSKSMTMEQQILLIAKLRENEKGLIVPNIADIKNFSDLVKLILLHKFQNIPKQKATLKEEYDAFVQRFQINEVKFNSVENTEDLVGKSDEESFEKTSSEVSTYRNQQTIDEESAIKTKSPRAFMKSKQHKPRMLNFATVPILPKIEGKKDLIKEMKRIENSLINVKKNALGISKAEEDTGISDDSFTDERKLPLISPKSEGRSFFLLKNK
ncbi:unnamed protein product [Blepharisma stoltei]|uniref:Uncharacterized protein n=1 Tax=Blepharisma stoltei TaxID=1481888 RepID=A0AAU9K4H4_9CILI|nr:unnamed protein product [Blepharisma stoltei]